MLNYIHILKNLPGILNRLETELQSKAAKSSVDTLRYTVTKKADVEFVVNLSGIINERLNERPTHADIVILKSDLGARLDVLESQVAPAAPSANLRQDIRSSIANAVANVEAAMLNAEKTGEPSLIEALENNLQDYRVAHIDAARASAKKARTPKTPKNGGGK